MKKSSKGMTRRRFATLSALSALGAVACRPRVPLHARSGTLLAGASLQHTPGRPFDLLPGFQCSVVQTVGDAMSCGSFVPAQPDGMTCHVDSMGRYVLLRNHELHERPWMEADGRRFSTAVYPSRDKGALTYNPKAFGGVSRVVLDPTRLMESLATGMGHRAVVSSNMVLTGTIFNCSGGSVPEGWITCEETDDPGHGYAFLTRIGDDTLVDPAQRRIEPWGRLKREGVSVDAERGIVYMTEDHAAGCLYRFVPEDPDRPMGAGRLEALAVRGIVDTDPKPPLVEGSTWATEWVVVDDPSATKAPCRAQAQQAGASRFNRCEGSVLDRSKLWFIASTAGPVGAGQVFCLDTVSGALTLAVQVEDRSVLSMPDNLTLSPWGDLIMTEDNYNTGGGATHQHIRGLRPDGTIYDFARNPHREEDDCGAEITGPCFSPDGRFLFVNLQHPIGATVAIHGPWPRVLESA